MRRVIPLVVTWMRHWYRSRSTLFWRIAFPILMIVLFGSIFGNTGNSKFDLYVQNQDYSGTAPTQLSAQFVAALNSTTVLNIHNVSRNDNLDNAMFGSSNPRGLIIQFGFQAAIIQDRICNCSASNATITLRRDQSQVSDPVPGIINTVTQQFNTAVLTGNPRDVIQLQTQQGVKGFKYIDFFIPGVIGMTVMTGGLIGAVFINTDYRSKGVLHKLATTPLTKTEWILGLVVYNLFSSLLSAAIIIGVGFLVYGVKVTLDPISLLMIISGTLAFTSIGMVIANYVKEPNAADAAGNAIAFPMMFLSGTFFPLEFYPAYLRGIANVLPLTYFNNGLRDAMINGNFQSAFQNTMIVLAIGLVFVVLGTLLTSWRD